MEANGDGAWIQLSFADLRFDPQLIAIAHPTHRDALTAAAKARNLL